MSVLPLMPLAKREGNFKKPIYQMHKWWARRLGVNFRFLLLAATSRSNIQEKTIWRKFYHPDARLELTVLDPFMGGGTSIVEATKLGARTIGIDIDPLAWFIVREQINKFDENSFMSEWQGIQSDLAGKLRSYYQTNVNGKWADVVYYFWVEIISCEHCDHEFEGHIHYILYSKKNNYGIGPSRMGFCRNCHKPQGLQPGQRFIKCSCGERTEVDKGNLHLGKYKCPKCNREGHVSDLPKEKLPLKHRLFAVEYIDPDTKERAYKKADELDFELFDKAGRDLNQVWQDLPIPDQDIPVDNRSDPRPVSLGYNKYHELFNPRQLLCLGLILRRLLNIPDPSHRNLLLLAFSDSLACNNKFCSYAFGYQKLTPLFGLHAFRRISRPVEGNVWGTSLGRGSFSSCVDKVLRGKRYSEKPFEYSYKKNEPKRIEAKNSAQANIVNDIEGLSALKTESVAYLTIADSRDLSWLPENSVDLVLTDPPYYDNLAYSEMADFYFVWLKKYVNWAGRKTDSFSPINDSLFVRKSIDEEHARYTDGLTSAFSGCRKVIKNEGLLVFTYHHINRNAWESLSFALRRSGFYVTNCFPILSEGKSGFHSDQGNLKWDIVFVCRPGNGKDIPAYRGGPAKRWLESRLRKWDQETNSNGIHFGEAERRCLAFGLTTSYLTTCRVSDEDVKNILNHLEDRFPFRRYERNRVYQED